MSEPAADEPAPLSDAAIGAITALVRVCELYDGAVAHRAALRAHIASLLAEAVGMTGAEHQLVIAAAALTDVELVIRRPLDPEADAPESTSLLGATLVSRIPGLSSVADALEHLTVPRSTETPSEAPEAPLATRIAAVSDAVVGNPAEGFVPTWDHALRRCDRLSGATLDQRLCEALHHIDLGAVDSPESASELVHELLTPPPDVESAPDPTPPVESDDAVVGTAQPDVPFNATDSAGEATAIKSAVAAAGDSKDLAALFADIAQRMVSAAEVVIMQFRATSLDPTPLAKATDGSEPHLDFERLDDLREFSTQAELRAGISLERPGSGAPLTEFVVPISIDGETWGVLIATRRTSQRPFDAHDSSVLRHIASEAADAVATTTHWAQMERMALRDQLTGLANRHELYRILDEIFDRPPLERLDCALIMCDVDGLKVVNDTLGHQAGDRLLIDAAAALRGAVRDHEHTTICRIGGDEFCLVIDGGALLTAHDVSDTIERLFARSAGSGPVRSISCGIAFANEEIPSRSALLRAADENQYQTKRARKATREAMIEQVEAAAESAVVERRAIRD